MEKTHLLTTGEFANAANITKQTLFHYDEIGLLKPHYKDARGYRYYSYLQYDILIVIDILKELGMTLNEIKQFIETTTPDQMIRLFQEKSIELSQKINKLNQIQQVIETKISITKQAQRTDFSKITLTHLEKEYLVLSERILDESDYEFVRSSSALIEKIERQQLNIGHPIGVMLHKDMIACGDYTSYAYLYNRIHKSAHTYEKPSGRYLIAYHIGDFTSIDKTYLRLLDYMRVNQLEMLDFSYEEYVLDAISVGDFNAYVTRISIPLK